MRYNEIAWRSGEVIYWTFTAIAGVIVLSVAANFVFDADRGEPVFRLHPVGACRGSVACGMGLPPCVC